MNSRLAGARSTFTTGVNAPSGLAFNSAGDLFEADSGSGNIYEFTPSGVRSTFASGLNEPYALAFQPVPDLVASDTNGVFKLTVSMPSPYYSLPTSSFNQLGELGQRLHKHTAVYVYRFDGDGKLVSFLSGTAGAVRYKSFT